MRHGKISSPIFVIHTAAWKQKMGVKNFYAHYQKLLNLFQAAYP